MLWCILVHCFPLYNDNTGFPFYSILFVVDELGFNQPTTLQDSVIWLKAAQYNIISWALYVEVQLDKNKWNNQD